ncbi:MAG TPA: hypothetical protein VN809_14030 [Telmatospirillum sp.]|nr:hypothetical protein [Telmatospirillum sp.]
MVIKVISRHLGQRRHNRHEPAAIRPSPNPVSESGLRYLQNMRKLCRVLSIMGIHCPVIFTLNCGAEDLLAGTAARNHE